MRKDKLIDEAEVRASVIFKNTLFTDTVVKMNETDNCFTVIDGITVTDGDENGFDVCSQVIYFGADNNDFYEKMVKLANELGIDEILYIQPEGTPKRGCRVAIDENLIFDTREVNFLADLSCTFIDEINISYENATIRTF